MAEAAAAIGLVASIITLVDLGHKIVLRINDFTALSSEVPRSITALTDRLPLLIQTLEHIQARAQAGHVPKDAAASLKILIDGMSEQIASLEASLARITPTTNASRLEKTIKGLQSLTKDEKLSQAVQKVHHGIDVLVLHQTTTNIDLSERILQELLSPKLDRCSSISGFGLCLGSAPQIDPDLFLGREPELQQLDSWLSPATDAPTQRVVSIVGMGGLGKTQLSLAYVRQHGRQYSSVFWLNAKDELSLKQSILALTRILFEDAVVDAINIDDRKAHIRKVQKWLSDPSNDRWLLVFDNYDDPMLPNVRSSTGFDIRTFFPSRAHGSILITTRSPKLMFSKRLVLQKLDDTQLGLAVLSQRAGRDLSHESGAQELARRLDGLPLALATAGVYIGQTGESCAGYLNLYEELWSDLHGPESEGLLEYADRTLSSTWTVSLDQVDRQDTNVARLFEFFALFSNDDIWYELIRAGASRGPAWMQEVTATKLHFDRAMIKLRDYSLVEVIPGSYRVHPCVHDWLLGRFQEAPDRSHFQAALNCIHASIFDTTDSNYWAVTSRLIRHAQRLQHPGFEYLWEEYSTDVMVLKTSNNIAHIYQDQCYYREAEQTYRRTLANREKVFGRNHMTTLHTVNSLGTVYREQGKLAMAEQMFIRALAGYEETLGSDHTTTLATTNNLGLIYSDQGKLIEADKLYTRALAASKQTLGPHHLSTLLIVNNLGTLYSDQGKLADAKYMFLQALAGYGEIRGPDHLETLSTVHNLGGVYLNEGKSAEAEQMLSRALVGYEKTLGPNHITTLGTVLHIGAVYYEQGKFVEAEQMYIRALSGKEKSLKSDNFLTSITAHNLGTLYVKQGRLAEAEQMYVRALIGKEKVRGPDHSSTLETVHQLGRLYSEQGKLVEAQQMFDRAGRGKAGSSQL